MYNIHLLLPFITKDILIQKSYRFDNILRILGILLQLILFYFIGKLINADPHGFLDVSGGSYFPFVLIGLAFSPIFSFGLSFCSNFIREETSYGTIEQIFSLPVRLEQILAGAASGKLLFILAECMGVLTIGFIFLEIKLSLVKILFLVMLACISILVYFGLGLMAGSFILVYKKGDPIQWVLVNISDILGGVFFPVTLFPGWIKSISFFIPTTHILSIARKAVLTDSYRDSVLPIIVLTAAGLLSLYGGCTVFRKAFNKTREKGSLGHF
ncbi:MAG: ABC transporter permease [bacterium]